MKKHWIVTIQVTTDNRVFSWVEQNVYNFIAEIFSEYMEGNFKILRVVADEPIDFDKTPILGAGDES